MGEPQGRRGTQRLPGRLPGLDNIGVFDRSAPLPTGGYINQSDGTSWMAMYSLNLMRIALELAQHNHVYEDIATKFFEHFLHIAEAMTNIGDGMGLWNEEDGFFYDVLNLPDGQMLPLKVRSMVGLIPLFAVETLEPELCAKVPGSPSGSTGSSTTGPIWRRWCRAGTSRAKASGGCCRCCAAAA